MVSGRALDGLRRHERDPMLGAFLSQDWAAALALVTAQVEPNINSFDRAVGASRQAGKWSLAGHYLTMMSSHRVLPDEIFCSNVISTCLTSLHWTFAMSSLQLISMLAVQPDVVCRGAVLGACRQVWKQAVKLLDQPEAAANVCCNAGISACASGSQWLQVMQLISVMRQKTTETDAITFSSAVTSTERRRYWRLAVALLSASAGPSGNALNAAISTYEKAGLWQRALGTQCDMGLRRVVATRITFNSLMAACEKVACWQQAGHFLRDSPDIYSFSSALSAGVNAKTWGWAVWLMERMKNAGVKPTEVSCSTAMSSHGWQAGMSNLCPQTSLDTVGLNAAVAACASGYAWVCALRLLQSTRVARDVLSYQGAVLACEQAQRTKPVPALLASTACQRICNSPLGKRWHTSRAVWTCLCMQLGSPQIFVPGSCQEFGDPSLQYFLAAKAGGPGSSGPRDLGTSDSPDRLGGFAGLEWVKWRAEATKVYQDPGIQGLEASAQAGHL